MATFTSVTTGDWDDGATWGNTSPGTKGTDWPGLAGDVVTISNGDTVTYNVSETNAIQVDINAGGELNFSTTMDTLLTLTAIDHDWYGNMIVGTIATPIDAAYTAVIDFQGTSGSQDLFSATTSTLSFCGDPDVFGSTITATLTADWTSGQTFTIDGDYTSLWSSGSELWIIKDSIYSNRYTDIVKFTIDTIILNGSNTDITINETFPTGTWTQGSIIWNVERNVKLTCNGVTTLDFSSPDTSSGSVTFDDDIVSGVANAAAFMNSYNFEFYKFASNYCVFHRNYLSSYFYGLNGEYNIFSLFGPGSPTYRNSRLKNTYWLCCDGEMAFYGGAIHGSIYNHGHSPVAISTNVYLDLNLIRIINTTTYGFIKTSESVRSKINFNLGYDENGVDFYNGEKLINVSNTASLLITGVKNLTTPASDPISAGYYANNASYFNHSLLMEDWNNTGPRFYSCFGEGLTVTADGSGVEPYQRSGGATDVWKITTYSNINSITNYLLLPIELSFYYAASAGAKTFTIYFQSNYSGDCEGSIDIHAVDGINYQNFTIAPRGSQSDWSQNASVSFTLVNAGWVDIKLNIYTYEAANYIWMDPEVSIT